MGKKILVTGANGQLGRSMRRLAEKYPQFDFVMTDVEELDICNNAAVMSFVEEKKPDSIVNCAAYTAVDNAEDNEPLCTKLNCEAVRNIGQAAQTVGARVIHISTDYVFNGRNFQPYTEDDEPNPASVYGRTKLAGEIALQASCRESVIIRTAWLYSEFGKNFVKTMLRLCRERDEIRVVFDQIGTPTYAGDLAQAVMSVVVSAEAGNFAPGIYHFTNEGVCSWYDFTVKIVEIAGLSCRVVPIETKDYPSKAERPHFSVLNKSKIKSTYGIDIPHWETSLRKMLESGEIDQ